MFKLHLTIKNNEVLRCESKVGSVQSICIEIVHIFIHVNQKKDKYTN